jgi:carbon storage regulator
MIGDDIEITVVDIRGDNVRLGITAPATVPVHRKEVYEAIQRENREAAKVRMEDLPNLPGTKAAPGAAGKIPMRPGRPSSIPVTRPSPEQNPGGNPLSGPKPGDVTPPPASPNGH